MHETIFPIPTPPPPIQAPPPPRSVSADSASPRAPAAGPLTLCAAYPPHPPLRSRVSRRDGEGWVGSRPGTEQRQLPEKKSLFPAGGSAAVRRRWRGPGAQDGILSTKRKNGFVCLTGFVAAASRLLRHEPRRRRRRLRQRRGEVGCSAAAAAAGRAAVSAAERRRSGRRQRRFPRRRHEKAPHRPSSPLHPPSADQR